MRLLERGARKGAVSFYGLQRLNTGQERFEEGVEGPGVPLDIQRQVSGKAKDRLSPSLINCEFNSGYYSANRLNLQRDLS